MYLFLEHVLMLVQLVCVCHKGYCTMRLANCPLAPDWHSFVRTLLTDSCSFLMRMTERTL